ncbi:hypothetical protein [Sphingomonas sp. Ant H11]|uniref:hypothetical protein n=1 Tax=Sphingomonas sp. Ant H11 TaxID=1564113 RepID=UPI001E444585|nr:hypothetical protein [Sphingomonas sp. Ant H11]
MKRAALLLVLVLAGCHRAEPKPAATPTPVGLEAAAIQAGVIPDPASTDITGLYARESDRVLHRAERNGVPHRRVCRL